MKQKNLGIFMPILITLASITVVSLVIFKIIGKSKDSAEVDSSEYNAAVAMEENATETLDWVDIVIVAVVGFAVLGIFAYVKTR